ncbi:MAG: hypothetical protein ACOH2N_00600 [Devosia sp.]
MSQEDARWPGIKRTSLDELPPDKAAQLRRTHNIVFSYLGGLRTINEATARDPTYRSSHLMRFLGQDLIEAAVAIEMLATEGVQGVIKRELRFIIEASAKLASVEQEGYARPAKDKLEDFRERLQSHKFSVQREVDLYFFAPDVQVEFVQEVGRLYGTTSSFVHWTADRIQRRMNSVEAGRVAGEDTVADIAELNDLLERALAASLVLVIHSVPKSATGDWMVGLDGETVDWHFTQSRFVAAIDAAFDYKHERQIRLGALQAERTSRIRF